MDPDRIGAVDARMDHCRGDPSVQQPAEFDSELHILFLCSKSDDADYPVDGIVRQLVYV